MDISAFKTFVEVAKTRHFGHAAENLFITQSAVSARIKLLEDNLGTKLFNRERGNLHLTYDGGLLLNHATTILATWERARQEVGMPEGIHVNLMIGALPGLWEISLQPWISTVLMEQAHISLHTDVHSAKVLIDRIISGSMDIAFVFDAPLYPQLRHKPLHPLQLRMVTNESGLDVSEAIRHHYIFVDWGTSFSIEHAKAFTPAPRAHLHTSTSQLAYKHLCNHGGSAYLAESMVTEAIQAQRLHYVQDAPVFERQAFAIYREDNKHRPLIETVLSF